MLGRKLFVLCATLTTFAYAQNPFRCGKERWSIKTGTDQGATQIDINSPQQTTIANLVQFPAPQPIPKDTRVDGPETTAWTINGTLTAFKFENDPSTGDSDYHLVVADQSGLTMIVEIPFPQCVGNGSPFAARIANARQTFDSKFTAGPDFQQVSVPVTVVGVGMFDFAHGQFGRSDNGIELHPVLDIAFGDAVTNAPPPPIPNQPAQPPPSPNQPGPSQIIGNPSFENGAHSAPWIATPGVIDNSASEPAHTGQWKAWLGGTGKAHTDKLSQKVTLPATATHATLTFWMRIDTDETANQPKDTLALQIIDGSGTVTTLDTYSNVNASTFHKRHFDLTDFIGQTITISLVAKEDSRNQTSFVVDDFAITAQ
jgi:hypothetical protein